MITIGDVAKRAGVSVATVSHVVNKTRYVSSELTEKVEAVLKELEYQPNFVVRTLRTTKLNFLTLIIPDITDPYYSVFIKGAEKVANENGYGLIVLNSDDDVLKEEMHLKFVIHEKTDGLIITPCEESNIAFDLIKDSKIPLVFVGRKVENFEADSILADNIGGAYKATNHLIKSGHERIAFINGRKNVTTSIERVKGYKKALEENGINFDSTLVVEGAIDLETIIEALEKVLSLENKPTAIFSTSYQITLNTLKYLMGKGLDCPQDISFVGFNDFDLASIFTPPITTVAQDPFMMGSKAAETLINRLKGEKQEFKEVRVPTELRVRGSTQGIGRGPFGEKSVGPDALELTESEVEEIKAGNYTAAISFHYTGRAWARLHEQGMKDAFNRLGIKLLAVTDAHFDSELQIKQHDSLLTMEPDVLISIPTDEIKTAESYKKIVNSKTKLVLITNVPEGLKHKDYVTCVSVNERENGQIAGRILGEHMSKIGKTKVGLLKHGAPFFATKQRDTAAEQVLREEFPNIEIVAIEEFINEKRVFDKCYNMIKAHPEIEGIYISWEGPALEAIAALYELNREDVSIVTADLDNEVALNLAKGGMIKGLSSQCPYEQGRAMALAAANALLGKEVPPFIGVRPYGVIPNNLLKAWQDILKEKPPEQLIQALRNNPNLIFDKYLKNGEK